MDEHKEKTIYQILDEMAKDICNNYCKYPEEYKGKDDAELLEVCTNCPLCKVL